MIVYTYDSLVRTAWPSYLILFIWLLIAIGILKSKLGKQALMITYQFERLTYALRTIVQRVQIKIDKKNSNTLQTLAAIDPQYGRQLGNFDVLVFTEKFNEKYEEKLVKCVKHYQKIVYVHRKFRSWFGSTYSIILAHSFLTLAMMSYIALLNENLSNEIYNLEWYKQPTSRRKLHYIFLCEVQKPLRLFGFLIYPASLTIFSNIMKLSYSRLNLLRTYESSTSSYRVKR